MDSPQLSTQDSLDVLVPLLQAQRSGILRFLVASYPYLDRAAAEVRRPLRQIVAANERQIAELGGLIDSLQGVVPPPRVDMEDQYLAFLTIEFILPKLLDDRKQLAQGYQTALAASRGAGDEVVALLQSHLAQLTADVAVLEDLVRTTV